MKDVEERSEGGDQVERYSDINVDIAAIKALRESAVKTDDRTKKSADVCNPPGKFSIFSKICNLSTSVLGL